MCFKFKVQTYHLILNRIYFVIKEVEAYAIVLMGFPLFNSYSYQMNKLLNSLPPSSLTRNR